MTTLVIALLGCRCSGTGSAPAGPKLPELALGGDRPALVIASGGEEARPLVLALHGYGDTASSFIAALGYADLAAREKLVLVAPDGSLDREGRRYWNATSACCNFFGGSVDDVAYLKRLIAEARGRYPIDPRRVYLIGLSNGGFMAYRLACDDAAEIAALVSIAGAAELDPKRCAPASPVSVLQVHGDADSVVRYGGGEDVLGAGGAAYPGAVRSAEQWAAHDRCASQLAPEEGTLDLDVGLPGAETTVAGAGGCPAGVDVRLWTIRGGPHVPRFTRAFVDESWAWLRAHPKVNP